MKTPEEAIERLQEVLSHYRNDLPLGERDYDIWRLEYVLSYLSERHSAEGVESDTFLEECRRRVLVRGPEPLSDQRAYFEDVSRLLRMIRVLRQPSGDSIAVESDYVKALEKVADASEKLFSKRDRKQISDRDFDGNLRHRKGSSPVDFLNHWLKLCRPHAYATQDDSWGELEKLLAIILRNYVNLKVFVKPQIKSALHALKQLRGGKNEWRKK